MLIRSQNIKKKGEEEEEKASFDGVVKTRNGTTSKTDRLMVSYKNIGSMATWKGIGAQKWYDPHLVKPYSALGVKRQEKGEMKGMRYVRGVLKVTHSVKHMLEWLELI